MPYEAFSGSSKPFTGRFVALGYDLLVILVFVNLLIAMFSKTFDT